MFRNRKNSQKPGEELYSRFRQSFPQICTEAPQDSIEEKPLTLGDVFGTQSLPQNKRDLAMEDRKSNDDGTPKIFDQLQMTPSIMDPTSYSFTSFAEQPPAYCSSAAAPSTISYPATGLGDMQTPGMQMHALTPLAMAQHASSPGGSTMAPPMTMNMEAMNNHFGSIDPQGLHGYGGQQNLVAPPQFLQREPDFGAYSQATSSAHQEQALPGMHHLENPPPMAMMRENSGYGGYGGYNAVPDYRNPNFRFQVTLRASTAMLKEREQIPVTYMNKGQVYTIHMADSDPLRNGSKPLRYRTYIRISFEDEEQREKPGGCWQLWKEGRGSNEAHQRNGKLLAVEHVDPNQGGDGEQRQSQYQVESASFDGFSVIWSPNRMTGSSECTISIRFNFLSTDFSHSKGVKGIPVRLCAKTDVLAQGTDGIDTSMGDGPEVSYCRVKLFRDHGAERKLSNDVSHVKKMLEKCRHQMAQAEVGSVNIDKRKRSGSIAGKNGKGMKHKRAWSQGDNGKATLEEDLHQRMENLQGMFKTPRPVSNFNLKGDPEDDPDLFPVQFETGEENSMMFNDMTWDSSQRQNGNGSMSVVSPTTSHNSFASSHNSVEFRTGNSRPVASQRGSLDLSASSQNGQNLSSTPVKIKRIPESEGSGNGGESFLDALDVDLDYQPPAETPKKSVCCFYIRPHSVAGNKNSSFYRAVYLTERTCENFVQEVAKKCQIDYSSIGSVVRVRGDGLSVAMDDDVVTNIPEGQDMLVEFSELRDSPEPKQENSPASSSTPSGIEMKAFF